MDLLYHRGINNLSKEQVDGLFYDLAEQIYSNSKELANGVSFDKFLNQFKVVVLANRHQKQNKFIENNDFNTIRKITSEFNYQAFHSFFDHNENIFLFNYYYSKIDLRKSNISDQILC